jgi:hypothetical protein
MLLAEFVICDDDATLPAKVEALDCCESDFARPSCDITDVNVCDITVGVLAAATCMAVSPCAADSPSGCPLQGEAFCVPGSVCAEIQDP